VNALRSMLFLAAIAGLAVGVAMTLMQYFATVPLILQAEVFEVSAPAAAHEHGAAEETWAPADGFQRMSLTAVANLVTAIGFGLLLVAVSEFAGGIRDWRQGLFWGLAGFTVFTLAPGLGLPPELPAMPAAELGPRQAWWVACVLLTGAGLALIVFGNSAWVAFAGCALIIIPHLIGAPQPESHDSPIPENLHHQFVVSVTVTNLIFWVLLGYAVSALRPRFAAELGTSQRQLA
jgi:cobalt transporter subunit CbtA